MSVLWFDRAEVILPLGHTFPLLVHDAVHVRDCGVHLVCPLDDPGDLVLGVVGNDRLCDGHGLIQVPDGVQLPLLPLDRDVGQVDDLQCLLLLHDHGLAVVPHEPGGHLQQLVLLGGVQQDDLVLLVLVLGHTVDLDLHPSVQHLGSLGTVITPGTIGSLVEGKPGMHNGGVLEHVMDELV